MNAVSVELRIVKPLLNYLLVCLEQESANAGRRVPRYTLWALSLLGAFGMVLPISPALADEANTLGDSAVYKDMAPAALEPSRINETLDEVAEADRERARQRLLDYLQRLRTRSDEPSSAPVSPISGFPSFGSDVFDAQLAGYVAYVNEMGTPDILIVGSSRALQGIDPSELRSQLAAQGYPGLKVYNFSVNGATAQVVNFVLSELLPGGLPPIVVWGDGSRAFNDGRRDRTWEALTASAGYQAILRGEKPVLDVPDITTVTFTSPSGTVISYEVEVVTTPDSSGEPQAGESFESFGVELSDALSAQAAVSGDLAERVADSSAAVSLVGTRLNGLTLDGLGFSAVSDRFDPAQYYQQFPRVSGQYDGAYSPFTLQGPQAMALAQVAETAARQNSQLIFVNLPLSDSYLDDFRLHYEDRFQQFLRAESDFHGFEVVDLLQAWQGQPDLFADPSHINQHGAAAIAAQLAFEPKFLLALRTQFEP